MHQTYSERLISEIYRQEVNPIILEKSVLSQYFTSQIPIKQIHSLVGASQVRELQDKGLNASEIADGLGLNLKEVERVINDDNPIPSIGKNINLKADANVTLMPVDNKLDFKPVLRRGDAIFIVYTNPKSPTYNYRVLIKQENRNADIEFTDPADRAYGNPRSGYPLNVWIFTKDEFIKTIQRPITFTKGKGDSSGVPSLTVRSNITIDYIPTSMRKDVQVFIIPDSEFQRARTEYRGAGGYSPKTYGNKEPEQSYINKHGPDIQSDKQIVDEIIDKYGDHIKVLIKKNIKDFEATLKDVLGNPFLEPSDKKQIKADYGEFLGMMNTGIIETDYIRDKFYDFDQLTNNSENIYNKKQSEKYSRGVTYFDSKEDLERYIRGFIAFFIRTITPANLMKYVIDRGVELF